MQELLDTLSILGLTGVKYWFIRVREYIPLSSTALN